jgi:ABC-type phosphate transport system ATPase subunit
MLLGRVIEHTRTGNSFLSPKSPQTAEYIEGRYG